MTAARTPASTWKKRVERWAASGLNCKEYAARIGVNPNTLAGWRWKLRREARESTTSGNEAPAPPAFVEVTEQLAAALAKEGGVIELEVGGAVVRLRGHVDADALSKVLKVLEGRR